jgi:hypothetical protein
MEYLFHHAVVPYLQKKFNLNSIIKVRLLHTSGMSEANVDDHVGEFELLSNPTVGLAAHSGVVDIRIAAKAESEEEADRLIEEVETPIRARLGTVIFGADDETLPRVTLNACAAHGWNAAALESGLDGWLTRALSADSHPNLLVIEAETFPAEELAARTRELCERVSARVGLGVALTRGASEQVIDLFMVTPEGEKSRKLTYGGPPNYSPRWAGNAALNWMRLQMLEKK